MKRCYICMKEYEDAYDMCPYCGHTQDEPPKELYFLHPGTVIQERYVIGTSVGSGGFGITYKAWDTVMDKVVAIKEYYPAGMVNRVPGEKKVIVYSGNRATECANGMVRFLDEARNMAKFNIHPNIINVYDFFEENNTAYIVMEFLDGVNFKQYLKSQGGKVPIDQALEITDAILEALKEVHKEGILHRDLSPDNIFLCKDGAIKLIDFGAARFYSGEEKSMSIILKPGFAPPEQYQTKSKQGPWTDIYALGATLYRAVTGKVPPESVNRVEEERLIKEGMLPAEAPLPEEGALTGEQKSADAQNQRFIEPKKLCPEMSDNLNNAILRAMALRPELRFQNTTEFKEALHSDGKIKNVKEILIARKKRRFVSIAAISAVVLVGALLCYRMLNEKKAAAAVLDDAQITVWIPADITDASETESIYNEAIAQFETDYPQITVDVVCMEREEYDTRLEEAMQSGDLPTLFESSHVDTDDYSNLADVTDVFSFIDKNLYYFYDHYNETFPSWKQLPMAFNVPVLYYNTILYADEDVATLLAEGTAQVTADNALEAYNLYGGEKQITSFQSWQADTPQAWLESSVKKSGWEYADAEQLFLDAEYPCILADSAFYNDVQKNLAGVYEMELLTEKNTVASFKDCYSIAESATEAEKAAAVQVLVYMLTDTAQDICYVQNGEYLPVNKSVYSAYVGVNTEFEGLSQGFDNLIFAGESQNQVDEWSEGLVTGE